MLLLAIMDLYLTIMYILQKGRNIGIFAFFTIDRGFLKANNVPILNLGKTINNNGMTDERQLYEKTQ